MTRAARSHKEEGRRATDVSADDFGIFAMFAVRSTSGESEDRAEKENNMEQECLVAIGRLLRANANISGSAETGGC